MAEYIEREALIESINNGEGAPLHKLVAECCVRAAPIADVVEVVRYKDCRHWRHETEAVWIQLPH
jgi:hypothetical protein